SFDTTHLRQHNIHQHNVWLNLFNELQTLFGSGGFPYNLDARLSRKEEHQPLADHLMIIDQENAGRRIFGHQASLSSADNGTLTIREVISPGCERILKVPPSISARSRILSSPNELLWPCAPARGSNHLPLP